MKVYIVQHVHSMETEDIKFIGAYSSADKAKAAITRLSQESGFSESTDGFHVDEYEVDKDHWVDGYITERFTSPAPRAAAPKKSRKPSAAHR